MKKTLLFAAIAVCAAAIVSSCVKNEMEVSITPQVGARTFTCVIADNDTKLGLSDAGKVTWEAGDEILIHAGKDGNEREIITLTANDIKDDGKVATITTTLPPYVHTNSSGVQDYISTYYAIYPASAVKSDKNLYYETRINDFSKPAMGGYDNGEGKFIFHNICSVIKYTVSGDFDSFTFVGNSDETVCYLPDFQYRVALQPEKEYFEMKTGNGAQCEPQKSQDGAVVADGTTVNYICIPGGAEFKGGFTIKFKKEGEIKKIAKGSKAVDLSMNRLLVLGDITSILEDYVAPQESDHKSEITNATDLSAQQANCFVIANPGAYKFPALKGSSEEAVGNVFDAVIVWESCNNAEDVVANSVIAAVDFEDNWMYFKTPDTLKPGNAVIAAKDVQDNIIWSWHIWIPSTAIETNTYGLFNHELMDRNLGALVAATAGQAAPVESFGLTYQWGRKDPFVSAAATSGGANAAFAGTAPVLADATITMAESIAKPTLLGHTDNGSWITDADNTMWQNDSKTIYDPCPAGYKVPARDKSQPLFGSDITAVSGWNVDLANLLISVGSPAATFPIAGYRDDYGPDNYSKLGTRVAYWTSYASSDATGYILDWRPGDDTPSFQLTEKGKSRGAYVRCVKIEQASGGEQPQEPTHTDVAVTLDGDMSEWANVESIDGGGAPMTWKYTSDANNVYFYAKITASKIKCSDDCTYKWRRYFYIGFDTDNNATTGQVEGLPGGLKIVGCEANALVYPFRGTAPAADQYPEGVECVNGVDEESWIKLADGTTTESKITAYGYRDGDYFYLEMGVPRAGLGSPAAGTMNVQFSFSWDISDATPITIK